MQDGRFFREFREKVGAILMPDCEAFEKNRSLVLAYETKLYDTEMYDIEDAKLPESAKRL